MRPREEEAWAGAESRGELPEALLIPAFGYKSHINTDRRHRLIRRFHVTHAAAHDGAKLPDLLNPGAFDSRARHRLLTVATLRMDQSDLR